MALSGGDELFAGYNRYEYAQNLFRYLQPVPTPLRRWVGRVFDDIFNRLPSPWRVSQAGHKAHKLGGGSRRQ